MEVVTLKARATCGGMHSQCTTYKDHPDWPMLQKMGFHIPKGEKALMRDKNCVCYKHAMEYIQYVKTQVLKAEQDALALGWI